MLTLFIHNAKVDFIANTMRAINFLSNQNLDLTFLRRDNASFS